MPLVLLTALLVFALDQASKWAVIYLLDLPNVGQIEVWPPFLVLQMGWNTGINFGLLSGQDARWLLVGLAVAIVVGVLLWLRRRPQSPLVRLGAGVLIGGALGNVIDRLIYGAVADFLNMSCCGIQNPYVFNLADVAIFAGAGVMILWAKDQNQG